MINFSAVLKILIGLVVVLVACFIYTFDFETKPLSLEAHIYVDSTTEIPLDKMSAWNPKRKIAIYAQDSVGIKSYKIKATTQDGLVVYDKEEIVLNKPKSIKFWLPKPEVALPNRTKLHYQISVTDWSNANFFSGNTITKHFELTINTKTPVINVIANSNRISYGGSALLVFQVKSVDIKEIQISNGKQFFTPFQFIKDGYYAVILAWPIGNPQFTGTISITDTALNTQKITIPFVRDNSVRYANATIQLKDDFLDSKMDSLMQDIHHTYPSHITNNFDKFKYINETIRLDDEKTITKAMIENPYLDFGLDSWGMWRAFAPLKGYVVVGKFGEKRTYIASDKQKSQSVHLGLDMASIKNDQIIATNRGKVILQQQLGVYGRTLLLYHGFGLSTLYSHLEHFYTTLHQDIASGDILGLTGQSGWAFGDHLHFGVYVQGLSVKNSEWMDQKWVKNNVLDVFEKAKKLIELQQ